MAYMRKIWPRRCVVCKRRATVELVNRYNSPVADYCASHGNKALKSFQEQERRSDGERKV